MPFLNNPVTQFGTLEFGNLFVNVTGGATFYVGTTAQLQALGDVGQGITQRCFQSVNAALAACVSGRGDTIYVMPGYTESIAAADSWSGLGTITDVTIIGMGRGTNRPTFTWTTATSTVLFDAANFRLLNCRLFLAGAHSAGAALTVAAPITVSAAGCEISDCQIFGGFDADQIVTIGITITGADYFKFNRNTYFAATAAVPTTTHLRIVGSNYMQMHDTKIQAAGSATNLGVVSFLTTASLAIDFRNCVIQNQLASSVDAVTGIAGTTGTCYFVAFGILDNATAVGFVTPGNVQLIGCQTSNDNGVGSAVVPA